MFKSNRNDAIYGDSAFGQADPIAHKKASCVSATQLHNDAVTFPEIKCTPAPYLLRQVPPISGTSSRVGYAITNLDMSGFRVRKEDVEVELVDLSNKPKVAVVDVDEEPLEAQEEVNGTKQQQLENDGADIVDATINPYQNNNGTETNNNSEITVDNKPNMLAGLSPEEMEKLSSLPIPPSGSPALIGLTPASTGILASNNHANLVPAEESAGGGDSGKINFYKDTLRDLVPPPSLAATSAFGSYTEDGTNRPVKEGSPIAPVATAVAIGLEKSLVAGVDKDNPLVGRSVAAGMMSGRSRPAAAKGNDDIFPQNGHAANTGAGERKPAEVLRVVAGGVRAEFKTLQWACRQVCPCVFWGEVIVGGEEGDIETAWFFQFVDK